MIVDDATTADLDAIVAFEEAFAPKERWSRGSWEEELGNPNRVVLVARGFETLTSFAPQPPGEASSATSAPEEGAERPSRRASGVLLLAPGPDVTDLMRIVVAPELRGKGVADALMASGFERCPGRWLLEVRDDNAAARSLYTKHDFQPIDRRKDYYGTGVDALILERTTHE